MGNFSRTFIRFRTQNGFRNAYRFYHSNGGRRVFPFTYKHYLKIERGGSLPQPSALAIMLKLFRRIVPNQEREELMRDYLRDLSGDAAVYEEVFAPLLAPSENPTRGNTRALLGRLTSNLAPAQFGAIVSSPAATGCFMLFGSVPDALPIEKIAELIGSSKEECLVAIKVLRRQRLVVACGANKYKCSLPVERRYSMPSAYAFKPLYDKLRKNIDRLAGKHGAPRYGLWSAIRLQPRALDQVISDLDAAFDLGSCLSCKMLRPGAETPLYFIEARVRRLVVFPLADDAALAEPAPQLGHTKRPAK